MQSEDAGAARLAEVARRLRAEYGAHPWQPSGEPLAELLETILSQHTSDRNAERAFAALQGAFPDLSALATAEPAAIVEAIRSAGLANQKGPRLKAVVAEIARRRGDPDLDFLADLPLTEAMAWLESLPGVGPKTAACVLLFALGRPAFPVDTHIHRLARRLGLVDPRADAVQTQRRLSGEILPDQVYQLHVDLITHGRRVCHARRPRHDRCVLRDLCPSAEI